MYFVQNEMSDFMGKGGSQPVLVPTLGIHALRNVDYNTSEIALEICINLFKSANTMMRNDLQV
jgi:hypothetical protein